MTRNSAPRYRAGAHNYLLGNDPPAYDILCWNNDTTRLSARLHVDFFDLIETSAKRSASVISDFLG